MEGTLFNPEDSIKSRKHMEGLGLQDLRRGGKNTQRKNCTKKIFTTQIIMMV